jgi:hypothetical protein
MKSLPSQILLAAVLLMTACFAQTPAPAPVAPVANPSTTSPTFTINASAFSISAGGSTTPATDIGGTFVVTPKYILRSDNLLIPGFNYSGNFGGLMRTIAPSFLSKTNLNPSSFQLYVEASLGEGRISSTSYNHTALNGMAGGGANYSPGGNSKFTLNILEARYAYLDLGPHSKNFFILSSGLQLGW